MDSRMRNHRRICALWIVLSVSLLGIVMAWKFVDVHASHRMGEPYEEIIAPTGTPRFYGVRECAKCGHVQYEHPAGKFMDAELKTKCKG